MIAFPTSHQLLLKLVLITALLAMVTTAISPEERRAKLRHRRLLFGKTGFLRRCYRGAARLCKNTEIVKDGYALVIPTYLATAGWYEKLSKSNTSWPRVKIIDRRNEKAITTEDHLSGKSEEYPIERLQGYKVTEEEKGELLKQRNGEAIFQQRFKHNIDEVLPKNIGKCQDCSKPMVRQRLSWNDFSAKVRYGFQNCNDTCTYQRGELTLTVETTRVFPYHKVTWDVAAEWEYSLRYGFATICGKCNGTKGKKCKLCNGTSKVNSSFECSREYPEKVAAILKDQRGMNESNYPKGMKQALKKLKSARRDGISI